MARNPNNPVEPDPNLVITGVDYRIRVESNIKGKADAEILVTIPKSSLFKDRDGGRPCLYPGFREMVAGARYILFVRKAGDGPGRWTGVAEPWRFTVDGGA